MKKVVYLVISAVLLYSCGENNNNNKTNTQTAKGNVQDRKSVV